MKSLYLLVNLFSIFIPVIFSFHKKIKFNRTWPQFFMASVSVGIFFLAWDAIFTKMGIWRFNPDYILGWKLFHLPIEEIMFFICIPFCCVFTYFCLDKFYDLSWNPNLEKVFCLAFSGILILLGFVYSNKLYTTVTFFSTAFVCLTLLFLFKIDYFGKVVTVYGILLLPFFIVNGLLTGTATAEPVVIYNNLENLNLRIFTVPIEDAFYGFELILLNIFIYKRLVKRSGKEENLTHIPAT